MTQTDPLGFKANSDASAVHVEAAPSRQRYELFDGDTLIGMTVYGLPDDRHLDFVHTEVDPEYGGRGLAGLLVEFAVADVRAQGKRIIAHCPYIRSWLSKHPEFDDIVELHSE